MATVRLTTRCPKGMTLNAYRTLWADTLRGHARFRAGAMSSHVIMEPDWYFQGKSWKGWMNQQEVDILMAHRPTYVIYSYYTPIAWWSPAHGWYVTRQKHSNTTTKHQSRVKWVLAYMAEAQAFQASWGEDGLPS